MLAPAEARAGDAKKEPLARFVPDEIVTHHPRPPAPSIAHVDLWRDPAFPISRDPNNCIAPNYLWQQCTVCAHMGADLSSSIGVKNFL